MVGIGFALTVGAFWVRTKRIGGLGSRLFVTPVSPGESRKSPRKGDEKKGREVPDREIRPSNPLRWARDEKFRPFRHPDRVMASADGMEGPTGGALVRALTTAEPTETCCCKSVREFWTLTHVPWRRAFVGKGAGAPVLGEGPRTRGQSPLLVGSRRGAKRGRPPGG